MLRLREAPPACPLMRLRAPCAGDGRSSPAEGGGWLEGSGGRGREEGGGGSGLRGACGGVVPPGDGRGGRGGGGSGGRGRGATGGGGGGRGVWRGGAARVVAQGAAGFAADQGTWPHPGRAAGPLGLLLHGRDLYHDAMALEGACPNSAETHFF